MCLNCGCMAAHDDMGKPRVNITYEDVKRAADANAMTVEATLAMIAKTADKEGSARPPGRVRSEEVGPRRGVNHSSQRSATDPTATGNSPIKGLLRRLDQFVCHLEVADAQCRPLVLAR